MCWFHVSAQASISIWQKNKYLPCNCSCHINVWIFYYDRFDVSEGTDGDKTYESRKCIICYYYYLLKVNFRFQPKVYDGGYDLMQKALSFNNVVIPSVEENDYWIHIWYKCKVNPQIK